ncbi:hypothetical protein MASR2M78_13380 [Treponema sp.]
MVGFGAIFGRVGKIIAGSILIWSSIAIRDLAVHARRVVDALKQGDLKRAREGVGMIVGRETENLDAAGVARAATESVAESFVDSIAAPLFWAVLLGPLGTLGYRAANTMDSMFGHKTEQYLHFGRVSAKIDDWLTWIPARLAGVVCCFAGVFVGGSIQRALQVFFRDRLKHESPNSAHGEAAFAGALTVRLGGPTVYKEGTIDKPWIGEGLEPGKKLLPCDKRIIDRAIHLMIISALLWAGLLLHFALC